MKKITDKGKVCYLYTEEEHSKALEGIAIAKRVKQNIGLFSSLESFFEEV